MASLEHLGGLKVIEPLNLEGYADVKQRTFQLPPKGIYTLRAPDTFAPTAFDRSSKGDLAIELNPTIVGGDFDGFQLKFTSIYNSPYKRGGQTVTSIGDYLRSMGVRQVLADEQQIADAVEGTAGQTFEVKLDWKGRNFKTGFTVKGMENFPKILDKNTNEWTGKYRSWVEDPDDYEVDEVGNRKTDDKGNPVHKRVLANLNIVEFIPRN